MRFSKLAIAIAALSTAVAVADVSEVFLEITAVNDDGVGTFQVMTDDVLYIPELDLWTWSGGGMPIEDGGGQQIAWLNNVQITAVQDPSIALNFVVTAGGSATNFTFTSPLLSFSTLNSPSGIASASITTTESDGNTATLTGLGAGGAVYTAEYNGLVPGGTAFANLLTGGLFEPNAFGSESDSDETGPAFTPIGVPVSDMSAEFSFTISANDQASGTSSYTIIPEPAAFVLLAMGVLFVRRR